MEMSDYKQEREALIEQINALTVYLDGDQPIGETRVSMQAVKAADRERDSLLRRLADLDAEATNSQAASGPDEVFLVAIQVSGAPDRDTAQNLVMMLLPENGDTHSDYLGQIEAWWVAEDDRLDNSDNDSAVFVAPGKQYAASTMLHYVSLTNESNITPRTQSPGRFA